MKTKTTKALGIGSAALALSSLFTGELYKYTFCRDIGLFKLLPERKKHDEGYYALRDGTAQRLRETKCILRSIINADGQTLRGFYYPCGEKPGKKVAFIVHGYRSEHAETAGMLREYYHSRGFDIFAPDNTASGMSGGGVFGYDVLESADCLKWLDFLKERHISLFTYHIPLDRNSPFSPGVNLARALGAEPYDSFFEQNLVRMGVVCTSPFSTATELAQAMERVVGHAVKLYNYAEDVLSRGRFAIMAGGAKNTQIYEQLRDWGVNTFITGVTNPEVPWVDAIHKAAKANGRMSFRNIHTL